MNLSSAEVPGFIGANFIRHMLSLSGGDRMVNLDKLTYTGNLANLNSVVSDPNRTLP